MNANQSCGFTNDRYVRLHNREDSHIYILLLSLNVLQIFAIITNAFTYITLVAIYIM